MMNNSIIEQKFSFYRCLYEDGDVRPDAAGAAYEARSAHDTVDGDTPASHPRASGANRAGN